MKFKSLLICTIFTLLMGCVTKDPSGNTKFDPASTGEVIGYAYILTKDQLNEQDLDNIKAAYAVFSYVVNVSPDSAGTDIKAQIFALIDEKIAKHQDAQTVAAIKIVVNIYWNKLQSKYDIEAMTPTDQLAMLHQVYIGIERAIGNQ